MTFYDVIKFKGGKMASGERVNAIVEGWTDQFIMD
jgi:hypothetical protein